MNQKERCNVVSRKRLRFKMGEKQIKERLNGISPKNRFYDYNYVKIHGNQGSFNQYCSLYSIYGALKFALNLDDFLSEMNDFKKMFNDNLKRTIQISLKYKLN